MVRAIKLDAKEEVRTMRFDLQNASFHELNPATKIVYFQMPKTGGLAYCQALDYIYQDEYFRSDDPQAMLRAVQRDDKRCFAGYVNLNFEFYNKLPQGFTHITLLQEPVSRIICMYDNISKDSSHWSYEAVTNNSLFEIFRKDLVRPVFGWCDQMGYISSMAWSTDKSRERPCNMLQQAKFNLENFFTFFGISERYDEFLEITRKALKWPEDLNYSGFNSIEEMMDRSSVDQATVDIISDYFAHDKRFYDHAVKFYTEKLDEWLYGKPPKVIMEAPKVEEPREVFPERKPRLAGEVPKTPKPKDKPKVETPKTKPRLLKRIADWFRRVFWEKEIED